MQKSSPLREPTLNREVIDCVLRTRRAHGGFVLLCTLRSHGDANQRASGRSLHSRPKPKTFQFFASLPRPLPALKREGKVFWFWFGVSSFKKLRSSSIYLRAFTSLFFASTPTRGALRSSVSTYSTIAHKPATTSYRHARIRSRSLLGGGGCSLFLGRAL